MYLNVQRRKLIAGTDELDDNASMSDVTRILSQIDSGDTSAAEQLLLLIYDELRKLGAVIASESISTSWLNVWASTNLVMQVEVPEQFPSTNQASG